MTATFDLPLDGLQREIAARALREAGAPFSLDNATTFRENVARTWGLYQIYLAQTEAKGLRGLAHRVDRMLFERKREEYIDDPNLPDARREKLISALDRLNRVAGTYNWFFSALASEIKNLPQGEVSILDVGSGHGAFPIRLAKKGKLGGHTLNITGSDISPLYVEKAHEAAMRAKARVDFRVIDALALDKLDERFDIITSSQTVHHFPPPFLAELMARVRANARHAMVLLDDRRSALVLGGAVTGTLAVSRDLYFLHDGVVSVRRMYSPAELELLGRCAPGGEAVKSTNLAYAYTMTVAKS